MNYASLANTTVTYYSRPADNPLPLWRRSAALSAVIGLHVLGLLMVLGLAAHRELTKPLQTLTVRMIETAPKPVRVEPPKPKPPTPAPPHRDFVPLSPVMTAVPTATDSPNFTVAQQPAPHVVDSQPAPPPSPAPEPVIPARFDADYLQNPQPLYPPMSRRAGEEGKVVLRVRVGVQGTPLSVEVKQSSGYNRLDGAARVAVEKWRFVPARQGNEAIESWVLVPLHFTLVN